MCNLLQPCASALTQDVHRLQLLITSSPLIAQCSWWCCQHRSPTSVPSACTSAEAAPCVCLVTASGFGDLVALCLLYPRFVFKLSGLYEVNIKCSFRHFCSLCTREKSLKRCKIVKKQSSAFLPHSCLQYYLKKKKSIDCNLH